MHETRKNGGMAYGNKGLGSRKQPLYVLAVILCISQFFAFSTSVLPAEKDQDQPNNETPKQKSRSVSITTGPDGKVVWLFDKNQGMAYGDAVVKYEDVTLKADHVWADMDNEVIEASGNITLEMENETILAQHMLFDLKNKRGIMKEGLSFDDPWYNSGKEMVKLNDEDSYIKKGSMTSCSLNRPHYSFEASEIVIHIKKELVAKHVIFKVGGVPLLYLPVYRRSLKEKKRARFIFKLGSIISISKICFIVSCIISTDSPLQP